jgi:hypothetical protein
MKKIFAGLFTAILLAAGLVAFSGSAQAAPECPYSGCVHTGTKADSPGQVKQGHRADFCVRVTTDGNGRPRGTVEVTVKRESGGFKWSNGRGYNDAKECFTTPKLTQRGAYTIHAQFVGKDGSGFRNSNDDANFKVVKR